MSSFKVQIPVILELHVEVRDIRGRTMSDELDAALSLADAAFARPDPLMCANVRWHPGVRPGQDGQMRVMDAVPTGRAQVLIEITRKASRK